MLEEQIYEESYQEDLNETLEYEVVQPCEEVLNSNITSEFVEQPSEIVENHIDYFICVWKHGCDIGCFGYDGDPIYDIEGNFQIKNVEAFPLEGCFSYMDDQDIW
jgi:hypothetical protein